LAKDIDFKEIVDEKKDILGVRYKTKKLEKGKYYYKVVAKDQNDNSMIAYDQVTTPDKKIHSGLMCFYIEEDGSVKK